MPKWHTSLTVDFDKSGRSYSEPFAFDYADDPPRWRSEQAANDNVLKDVVQSVDRDRKLVLLLPAGAKVAFAKGKSCKAIRLEVKDEYGTIIHKSWGGGEVHRSEPWVLHVPIATRHFGKPWKPMFGNPARPIDPKNPKTVPNAQIGFSEVNSGRWLVTIAL